MALALTGSTAGIAAGRPGRVVRQLGRDAWARLAAAPATAVLIAALVFTFALVSAGVVDADWLQRWASTNVANLHRHPVTAMIVSAFVLTGPSVVNVLLTGFVCASLERRVGALRMLAVGIAGQVIASLVTEGAVRLAIRTGNESWAAAFRFDVGISYVMFTVAAAATMFAPARARRVLLAVGIAVTLAQLAAYHDMTSSGHAVSYAIGLLCWPLLARDGTRPELRVRAAQSLGALTVIGLLAIYLPLSALGLHPVHHVHVVQPVHTRVVSFASSGAF